MTLSNQILKKNILIFLLVFASATPCRAQNKDDSLIAALLHDIAADQVSTAGEFYAGSFPSYRECRGVPHNYRPDNNIFFTALSIFSLRNILPQLSAADKIIARQIIDSAQKAFPFYADKSGLPFYSFWPNGKGILPHAFFINKIKLIDMGQDADDAVMSLMATAAADSTCSSLKKRMLQVNNGNRKKTNSTYRRYRNIPAYSTWLGYKMKPDFDLGVHCNILYFMLDKKMPLVKQDSATIQLIAQVLQHHDYKNSAPYISPFYARTPVLMYHLAKLMGRFYVKDLEPYKTQLITDIQNELTKTNSLMDHIILSTSLLRLGAKPAAIDIPSISTFEKSGTDKFVFFQARAAFPYPTPLKQIFLHWSYLVYNFYCPVYNKVLLLEYLVERNK